MHAQVKRYVYEHVYIRDVNALIDATRAQEVSANKLQCV